VKLNVTVTGQDERRLSERIEQLIRARAANTPRPIDIEPPPPQASTHTPRDRRS
jgi:hypothetical protein